MTEAQLQTSIVQALQMRGAFAFSVPNEALGQIHARAGHGRMAMLKAMGLRSGVSDLVVLLPGRVVFMEVKTATGRQSDAQRDFEALCKSLGLEYHLVRTVEEAVGCLRLPSGCTTLLPDGLPAASSGT